MSKPIQISILQPCHKKWADMAPANKGRFCAACQKVVTDFTKKSDREIAEMYKSGKYECGIFLDSQLNRNLVIPKKKQGIWPAVAAGLISFFTLGTIKSYSQKTIAVEQFENKSDTLKNTSKGPYTITWTVKDSWLENAEGVKAWVKGTSQKTRTDAQGNFSLTVNTGDIIKVKAKGKKTLVYEITDPDKRRIILPPKRKRGKVTRSMGRYF